MSKVTERHYTLATFLSPGLLFTNDTSKEVKTKDPAAVAKLAPKSAFCFYLQDYVDKRGVIGSMKFEKTEKVGKPSPRYYLGGTVYTSAEIKKKFGKDKDKKFMVSRLTKHARCIQCKPGNWQPFEKGDVLLNV